jgi:hypothetical protein
MDQPTQPDPIASLPTALLATLLRMLAAAVPTAGLTPETAAETIEAARLLFFAMRPRDAVEAAAAVRAVAAHFASMDMYARAARPGISDPTARSLHASAQASDRAAAAPREAAISAPAADTKPSASAPPTAAPEPADPPKPPVDDRFQPHDRFGQPIPRWDTQKMTKAQLYAVIAYPRDPEMEKAALADEVAMQAEQEQAAANSRG